MELQVQFVASKYYKDSSGPITMRNCLLIASIYAVMAIEPLTFANTDYNKHYENEIAVKPATGGLTMIGEPVGINYPDSLSAKLQTALRQKGIDYRARTEHLQADGSPLYTNRLILENSPYLIQHAHNPVDWYSWGEEAFLTANQQDKPIFLSIGYSTCHWCHVMERESFDNPRIAAILNEHFIAIKVDREQHPDIDNTYMTGVMLLTGGGGWPLSSFITPQGNTFYGGTYYKPEDFANLLTSIANAWQTNRKIIEEQSQQIANAVQQAMSDSKAATEVGEDNLEATWQQLISQADTIHGGFGASPKFPNETSILFLLERARLHQDEQALALAVKALDGMAQGGIYDQVGGGFHRYATDEQWLIPHFEKMLYNQAMLSRAYIQAYQLTQHTRYRRIVEQTLDYVLREMTAPTNGFYSATDADSEGHEGRFFVWTFDELNAALTEEESRLAVALFGVTDQGNFEGRSILYLPATIEEYAQTHSLDLTPLYSHVDRIREKLRVTRNQRPPPLRDDKIILAWNGMMITAFAEAGYALGRADYTLAAENAAEFLWHANHNREQQLYRINLSGKPSIPAMQEDYACYAEALIKLYDVTQGPKWLERARLLTDTMIERFWDQETGGFYMSEPTTLPIMSRPKESTDNATPSGNSVALRVLAQLNNRVESHQFRQIGNELIRAFSSEISRIPQAFTYMMLGISELKNQETSPIQHAGNGHIRIELIKRSPVHFDFDISIDDGWHINAHKPLQDFLIPTSITLSAPSEAVAVVYPQEALKQQSFQQKQLALYEGQQTITVELAQSPLRPEPHWHGFKVELQACSSNSCLAPEKRLFNVR